MVSVRPPSLPAPSFPHTSPCLSFSLRRFLPSLPSPSLPSPTDPGGRGEGEEGRRGAARWGLASSLFAKPASPLSHGLLSLPSFCTFSYFQLTSLGRAHARRRRRPMTNFFPFSDFFVFRLFENPKPETPTGPTLPFIPKS